MRDLAKCRDELRRAIVELGARLERFKLRQSHFAGDLSFWGFAAHVRQHANAVFHLADPHSFGTALFANARAAFEAAQDALYLATETDYSAAGSRVRVFERLEFADINADKNLMFLDDPDAMPEAADADPYSQARVSILSDAEKWDTVVPGRGDLLRAALATLEPQFAAARSGSRHPGHWSGISRRKMAIELERRVGEEGFAAHLVATYAALSRGAHPRFRGEEWVRNTLSERRVRFESSTRSVRIAVGLTEVSVRLGIEANDRIQPPDPV